MVLSNAQSYLLVISLDDNDVIIKSLLIKQSLSVFCSENFYSKLVMSLTGLKSHKDIHDYVHEQSYSRQSWLIYLQSL